MAWDPEKGWGLGVVGRPPIHRRASLPDKRVTSLRKDYQTACNINSNGSGKHHLIVLCDFVLLGFVCG